MMLQHGVTPLPDSRLRQWRKLRMAKYRKKTGLFVAEGLRTVEQLLRGGRIGVRALLLEESFAGQAEGRELAARAREAGAEVFTAGRTVIAELADTATPQPVAAVCRIPAPVGEWELAGREGDGVRPAGGAAGEVDVATDGGVAAVGGGSAALVGAPQVVLALDAIQDPGNLGAILRTAAWFGVRAVVCGRGTVDAWNPKSVRATAGALGAVPLGGVADLAAWAAAMGERGWIVASLELGAEASTPGSLAAEVAGAGLGPSDLASGAGTSGADAGGSGTAVAGVVLVLGNEANGVSPAVSAAAGRKVRIPGDPGAVESLNAAVAASIVLYELLGRGKGG